MNKKTRIVIAEDHTILREGLRSLLESRQEFAVVGEARDGLEAIQQVDEHEPDLVLLDLSMPKMNGIAAVKEIKRRHGNTRVLALTVQKSEDYVLETLASGAEGYCLKDASSSELLVAINNVMSGKRYIAPGISDQVLEGYLEGKKTLKTKSSWDELTQREREVLKLIGEGHKNKQIADILCISVKTVEKHRANIMDKLDLHNASALTAYAIERGLVTR
ncbi:MAG: response regulator [Desulfatibacillaceae bacterium]